MDVVLAFSLFGCIFLLPVGCILLISPRLRKLGLGLIVLSVIGLAVSAVTFVKYYYH